MVSPQVLGSSIPEQSRSGPDAGLGGALGRWGKEFGEMMRNRSGATGVMASVPLSQKHLTLEARDSLNVVSISLCISLK